MNAPLDLVVRPLDASSGARWDAFVRGHPKGSFFHLSGWKGAIERAFGHPCHYLYAERAGRICGVLPLVHVKSRLFSNGLISNAFCVQGGSLAEDGAAEAALDDHACALMDRIGADFLEYRRLEPRRPDWTCRDDLYVTFRRPIQPDAEANLKAIPRKQRAVLRKAVEAGELSDALDEDVDRLHRVYAESVRNLGTPVFAKRWFRALKEAFADDCQVLTVTPRRGEPVASVMSFVFRDEILPYYGGGTPAARGSGANDFMYWRVMERAREQGLKRFDFGRSKRGTGAYAFKKNWGFEPEPLFHEFRLKPGSSPPDVNPLNPKYRAFITVWKRLPLPIANTLGPLIVRNLG
jgi:FemAB-related protein (PEP-CTERM system-associated)